MHQQAKLPIIELNHLLRALLDKLKLGEMIKMENATINLEQGKYIAQIQTLKKDEDESSAMAPYLSEHVIITHESGHYFITLMIQEEQVVTGFQLIKKDGELNHAIDQQIDQDTKVRYEIFQLENFRTMIPAQVQYEIDHEGSTFKGDEKLRLYINQETIQNVNDIDLTSQEN